MRSLTLKSFLVASAVVVVAAAAARAADDTPAAKQQRWSLENEHLGVVLDPQSGTLTVTDKAANHEWKQLPPAEKKEPRFRNVRAADQSRQGIAFEADFGWSQGKPTPLTVTLTLPEKGSDLVVEADTAKRNAVIEYLPFLEPLVLDSPHAVLAVADYSNGHLYPLSTKPLVHKWFSTSRLDMPWVGVCDLEKGFGYAIIVETSDDGAVEVKPFKAGGKELAAPRVLWTPCKKEFAYPRRLIYHFAPRGGYVALAKRYREYARAHGLIVPFAEKLKKNAKIERLFGAPDVWGNSSLKFAREAKAAGIEKMLIHGRSSPKEMKAINELGYLTSEYDNYTDVFTLKPGQEVDALHDRVPENVVLKADGQRMPPWLTFDKKEQ